MSNVVRLEYAYGVCPKCKKDNYLRYLIRKDGLTHKPYEIKCLNCNSYFKKEDIFGNGEETTPKPMTNYECLISKTPEEMAKFLTVLSDPKWHIDGNIFDITVPKESSWLSWLESQAEVDK